MSRSSARIRLASTALLALAAACGDGDDTTGPTAADARAISADIAASVGYTIASDLALLAGDEVAAAVAVVGPGADRSPGTCTREGRTRVCTGGREGTLTVSRSVDFFDAGGSAMDAYHAERTASIRFTMSASGSFSATREDATMTGTVTRERTHVVSGLAGIETQRIWNGTGSGTSSSTATGARGTRTHVTTESDTTTNLVWVVAPVRALWPASGTVTRRIQLSTVVAGDRGRTVTSSRRVTVAFNGTGSVPMTISSVGPRGAAVELSCTLQLATRRVQCAEE